MLARIAEFYAASLLADGGYTGVLSHNPMSRAHGRGLVTTWGRTDPYLLEELAAIIPHGWRRPETPRTDVGRNHGLFRSLSTWAGSPANIGRDVLTMALTLNLGFDPPLPVAEVEGIAKSVEKYRAKQTYYSLEQRTLWGRTRQAWGVTMRRAKNRDRDAEIVQSVVDGESMRSVAARFGLSYKAVWNIVQRERKPSC